jgi:hypothetical protein
VLRRSSISSRGDDLLGVAAVADPSLRLLGSVVTSLILAIRDVEACVVRDAVAFEAQLVAVMLYNLRRNQQYKIVQNNTK